MSDTNKEENVNNEEVLEEILEDLETSANEETVAENQEESENTEDTSDKKTKKKEKKEKKDKKERAEHEKMHCNGAVVADFNNNVDFSSVCRISNGISHSDNKYCV